MTYWDKKLAREQLDEKLIQLKETSVANMYTGWIKLIRNALGMSTKQLSVRTGIDQSRITKLEKAEVDGNLTLSSLKKIADGLNMRFVYAFVPEEGLEKMVNDQAEKIAKKRISQVNQSMKLEDQELTEKEKMKTLKDLTQRILIEEPKDFWDQ